MWETLFVVTVVVVAAYIWSLRSNKKKPSVPDTPTVPGPTPNPDRGGGGRGSGGGSGR